MANWQSSLVSPSANYISLLDTLALRDEDAAKMAEGPTNPPTGYLRFSRAGNLFQEWSGSAWTDKIIGLTGGGTGASSAAGAATNLGLGTMAFQNNNAVNITGGTIAGITSLSVSGTASILGPLGVTGNPITITSGAPQFIFDNNSAGANLRKWDIVVSGVSMFWRTLDDAGGGLANLLTLNRAGNLLVGGSLTVITGNILIPAQSRPAISISNTDNTYLSNTHAFRNASGVNGLTFYQSGTEPASHPGGQNWFIGGFASPVSGKLIFGDGSGWIYSIGKKSAGTITDLFLYEDSGIFRADSVKALNAFSLTLEAFVEGNITFRLTGLVQGVVVSASTIRFNRLQAWDSFSLVLEAFTEGNISFKLTGTEHARLQSASTLLVDKIQNLNAAQYFILNATGSSPLLQFQVSGQPWLSCFAAGVSTHKCIGLGGNANYALNTPTTNNLVIAQESIIHLTAFASGCEITGIAGGYGGRVLIIECDATNLAFIHRDGRSAGNNQFQLPGNTNLAMNPSNCAIFIWDEVIAKWTMISKTF